MGDSGGLLPRGTPHGGKYGKGKGVSRGAVKGSGSGKDLVWSTSEGIAHRVCRVPHWGKYEKGKGVSHGVRKGRGGERDLLRRKPGWNCVSEFCEFACISPSSFTLGM